MITTLQTLIYEYLNTDKRRNRPNFWSDVSKKISDKLPYYFNENKSRKLFKKILRGGIHDSLEFEKQIYAKINEYPRNDEHIGYISKSSGGVGENDDNDDDDDKVKTSEKYDGSLLVEVQSTKYYFDEAKNCYVFFLRSSKKPFTISVEALKLLKARYSNWDGNPSSINEICRDFAIPRAWFTELKTILGWTHDSDPFIDSDILKKEEELLIEEALQLKRQALFQKFEEAKWKEIKEKAHKFDELDQLFIKPILNKINSLFEEPKLGTHSSLLTKLSLGSQTIKPNGAFVIAPFDFHVGKYSIHHNGSFSYKDENYRIMKEFDSLFFKMIGSNIHPEEIIVPIGSDFFHIDSAKYTTTAGTSQVGQNAGDIFDMLYWGHALAYGMIDTLVEYAQSTGCKIHLYCVQGNHDKVLSFSLYESVIQRYRIHSHVVTNDNRRDRKYHIYGENLLGFVHGENLPISGTKRDVTLMKFMFQEAKSQLSNAHKADKYYMFSGHYHMNRIMNVFENDGVTDIIVPSLSTYDRWHHEKGFDFGNQRVAGYIFDPKKGLSHIIYN